MPGIQIHQVVRQLSPGEGLIEELGVVVAGAGLPGGEQHLLDADGTEMEVGREPAGGVDVRVAALAVTGEALGDEIEEPGPGRSFAAAGRWGRGDGVIDVAAGHQGGDVLGGRRLAERLVERDLDRAADRRFGIVDRVEMVGQGVHQDRPNRSRHQVFLGVELHRHHGGGVDGDDRCLEFVAKVLELTRLDEGREEIGHDERRSAAQGDQRRGHEAAVRLLGSGFEVERVSDAPLGESVIEIDRRLEDEAVEPVAGPGVVVAEALVDEDREPELVGLLDGEVEGEVGLRTHGDALHPVEHELPVWPGPRFGGGVDSKRVNHCRGC